MSLYPAPATAQPLYETSNIRRHDLGNICQFQTPNGAVEAVYVRNNNAGSIAAGLCVAWGATGFGYADTAPLATAAPADQMIIGGLAASLAASSDGGYGWVIRRGPQTNVFHAATLASSAGARALVHSSNAALSTSVSTVAVTSTSNPVVPLLALMRPNSAFSTSGTGAAAGVGVIVDWLWR